MLTYTSVSGGKTSSMMALEHRTDRYVFAVVLTKDKNAIPKDKGLLRECQNKIAHFRASREVDLTLLNILRLEQELGQEIKWVASEFTFEDFIYGETDYPGFRNRSRFLPGKKQRFCTQYLKILPIFWHLHQQTEDIVLMNIGYRWDEPKRVEGWTCDNERFKFPASCALPNKRWNYKTKEWRISRFPLYEERIDKWQVAKYWDKKGWKFPAVSNCDFCFHHRDKQQQRQFELYPDRAKWWMDLEAEIGHHCGDRPLQQIIDQTLLPVFDGDDENPCHCTD
jgi:hypothetical protein